MCVCVCVCVGGGGLNDIGVFSCMVWPNYELFQDFMRVPISCNRVEEPIKTEGAFDQARSNMAIFGPSKASNPEVNSQSD